MRTFNVFSELVVPYPNEKFNWTVNEAEIPKGQTSVTVSSSTWCLQYPSYTVGPGDGTEAFANGTGSATFTCNPPAPDVRTQTIALAAGIPIGLCNDVNVEAGDYFIWKNETNQAATITPDQSNPGFWPLPGQQHDVPRNGFLALQIPEDANDGTYLLLVKSEDGSYPCPQLGQPKLIVGSGM